MIGLAIPLAYIVLEVGIYYAYRLWKIRVETDLKTFLSEVRPAGDAADAAVLRFSRGRVRMIWGIVCILMAFFLILALYVGVGIPTEPRGDLLERVAAMTLVMCICGLGPWLLLLEPVGNIRVVTRKGIFKRSPWTGISFTTWGQIKSVRWIPILDNFFIQSDSGIFAVSPVYEDLDIFAVRLMENVSKQKWQGAAMKLERARRGPFQP
jgi:hypothetical protein